jgi:hypothetical protein
VSSKNAGAWSVVTNIVGPTGATGAKGDKGDAGTNGTNGVDGLAGVKGDKGDAGTNGTNGIDGLPGAKGDAGTNGTNGVNGTSIIWLGSFATAPGSPLLNQAYFNTTDGNSYVYGGSSWALMAQKGATGSFPSGTAAGDMQYWNGSAWTMVPKGNAGQVLTESSSQIPIWTNPTVVTDIDGNIYSTVTIGTQTWMKQDLKTTRYNDGAAIPLVTDNTAWAALTTPGYCLYNNTNNADSIRTFGALYNWYAVNTGKLAPTGWHVATDAEWTTLTTYLGGTTVAGG